ncbi:MAG: response regulator, partial [bacterium]|nr:response regulator [bacterium]
MTATILCVDDDSNFRRILSRALREQGYQVETAGDGETALERLRTVHPDLVTLDVMLPRKDGFSVLEEIRRGDRGSRLPVVMLSGCRFTPDYEARARDLEADVVLTKPVPLKTLFNVVGRLVPDGKAASQNRPLDLSGLFTELPFPALLHHLHGLRASGVLRIQQGTKKKLVQLRGGQPVSVRSNMVKETLGHLLVASGTISWDVLHESVRRVKRGEGLQGQILKAMFMLDDADLAHALYHQAEQRLLEVFSWNSGSFRFQQGAKLKGETVGLKRSPASLILEGVRERASLEQIDAFLTERAPLHALPSSAPFHAYQDIGDDPDVETLLDGLDGRRNLSELSGLGEAERRILYGLIVVGRVDLETASAGNRPIRSLPRAGRVAREEVRVVDDRAEGRKEHRARLELTELAARFEQQDEFEMLGVTSGSNDAAIRKAFAELAHRTHPDRFAAGSEAVRGLAEQVFDRVNRAYKAISTSEARRLTAERREDAQANDLGQKALRAERAFQRGRGALRARRFGDAVTCFAEAVEAYPEEGEYHAYYGWSEHLAAPADPVALRRAKKRTLLSKKLAPQCAAPFLILGRLCNVEGKTEVAERLFTRAVEVDPECEEALQELRLISLRRKRKRGVLGRI